MANPRNSENLYHITTGKGFIVVDIETCEVLCMGNTVTLRRGGESDHDGLAIKSAIHLTPIYFKDKSLAEDFIYGRISIGDLQERLQNLNITFTFTSILKR